MNTILPGKCGTCGYGVVNVIDMVGRTFILDPSRQIMLVAEIGDQVAVEQAPQQFYLQHKCPTGGGK